MEKTNLFHFIVARYPSSIFELRYKWAQINLKQIDFWLASYHNMNLDVEVTTTRATPISQPTSSFSVVAEKSIWNATQIKSLAIQPS